MHLVCLTITANAHVPPLSPSFPFHHHHLNTQAMTDVIDSTLRQALDLLRRLPPSSVSSNLELIADVCPDIADELFSSVDQPLRVRIDSTPQGAGREYLACDYNRDGDSWRSPWSSLYDPPIDDGTQPSQKLRQLEIKANDAFNTYRQL